MDFAMQTDLLRATEYFNEQIRTVYVRHDSYIYPFKEHAHNPEGGKCYYLSTWALMGLRPQDCLIRGQIDLPKRCAWCSFENYTKNYKHGWVQFSFKGNWYVYDSLEKYVWPQTYWEETFNPHNETFRKSQQEILDLVLGDQTSKNAYQVSKYIYQLKCVEDMELPYNDEDNGFLKDTLSGAQIRYYGDGQASYFLAEDRSQ